MVLRVQAEVGDEGVYCGGCVEEEMAGFLKGAWFNTVAGAKEKYLPRFLS